MFLIQKFFSLHIALNIPCFHSSRTRCYVKAIQGLFLSDTSLLFFQKQWFSLMFFSIFITKEEFGHCQVPLNYGGVLGDWVRRQRMFYRKLMAGEPSPLTHEKALRLSSVGFCFE